MNHRRAHRWPLWAAVAALLAVPALAQEKKTAPPPAPSEKAPAPPAERPGSTGAPEATPLTLEELEKRALDRNPTLNQADAAVEVARGRRRQAGLYPNPVIHYHGDEIGVQ